jgi:hypothetical protein
VKKMLFYEGLKPKYVDNRDCLPFELFELNAADESLGSVFLEPNTGCGDLIDLGERGSWKVFLHHMSVFEILE